MPIWMVARNWFGWRASRASTAPVADADSSRCSWPSRSDTSASSVPANAAFTITRTTISTSCGTTSDIAVRFVFSLAGGCASSEHRCLHVNEVGGGIWRVAEAERIQRRAGADTRVDATRRTGSQTRRTGGPRQTGGPRWRCIGSVHEMRRASTWLVRTGFSARRNRRRRTTLRRADDSAAGSAAGSSSIGIACAGSTMLDGATADALPRQPSIMNSATTMRTTDRPETICQSSGRSSGRFDPLVR